MIYWIESMKDGSSLGAADTYEQADELSKYLYEYKGIDNYIREEK